MKLQALDTFVCPLSKSPLSLVTFEEKAVALSNDDRARCEYLDLDAGKISRAIKEGVLFSEESGTWYPIINHVPLLLDYPTRLHREFKDRYRSQTPILDKFELPNGTPRPGEESTQRTFTREWESAGVEEISFGFTPEQRDFFVELELVWAKQLNRDHRVLDIGCGSGFEAESLARVTGGEVFGFDLNLDLVRRGADLAGNPFLNVAVSSLYKLPLLHGQFDLVYSNGVLHHTHSTKDAFDEIFQYKSPDGVIYLWVYAREDDIGLNRSYAISWLIEETIRPTIAKAPEPVQNAIVKLMALDLHRRYKKSGGYSRDLWKFADSERAIRDRWTCLFAYRHSYKEVIMWFLDKGLDYRIVDPKAYYDYFKSPMIGIGIEGAPKGAFIESIPAKPLTE